MFLTNYNIDHDAISICSRKQIPRRNVIFRFKTKHGKPLYITYGYLTIIWQQNMTFQESASCIHTELRVRFVSFDRLVWDDARSPTLSVANPWGEGYATNFGTLSPGIITGKLPRLWECRLFLEGGLKLAGLDRGTRAWISGENARFVGCEELLLPSCLLCIFLIFSQW